MNDRERKNVGQKGKKIRVSGQSDYLAFLGIELGYFLELRRLAAEEG